MYIYVLLMKVISLLTVHEICINLKLIYLVGLLIDMNVNWQFKKYFQAKFYM